ncbi:protein SCAI-like [Tripterygium wilfordii]|uniref:protein SCAI-like n=1 Tax=Tripterygium wilfordii TaxID=458696 RepID=UPI0018F863DB|nr:protein SCAI-like [Tripterygium wilfordii]
MANNDVVSQTFRALVESADRKFARVRDLPQYGRVQTHYFQKVFKAYMRLWKYQQENRSKLVEAGLNRWEIGEIASRIGQLYFNQYMRTSESRFLVEAYVFYEAILSRRYFEGSKVKDPGVGFKELRFYARFLLVSLILNRSEMVKLLVEKLGALVDDSKTTFREANFKEWKLVVQEIVRFMNVDASFTSSRPLRYCAILDSHPASRPYVARFHAKKVLKFQDALLTSYHHNEVKFAELTLDTFRMVQCLEWEPSGSFYQKHPIEAKENGAMIDHSGTSGVIDMNLAADLTDPSLPPNPRKAILYRPSATHFLAVMATMCEELRPESVMLIYLSAPGKASCNNVSRLENSGVSGRTSKGKVVSHISHDKCSMPEAHTNGKGDTNGYYDSYLWFGPKGNGGSNNLYPGDIIPFTRKPIFLIIDSDNSHAFKVLHGAEMGETAAIILSPLKPAFKNQHSSGVVHNGSQFTFFLTAPLRAFCQMVGLSPSYTDADVYNNAQSILSTAFSAWEVILCTLTNLDLVWAQVLCDPFLRRLILRFIFCRSVLYLFCPPEEREQYLPVCLPHLPSSVSPSSDIVRSAVISLSNHFNVAGSFRFDDT